MRIRNREKRREVREREEKVRVSQKDGEGEVSKVIFMHICEHLWQLAFPPIGTDATHAEHIETIKSRMYVGLQDLRFVPGQLGMGLVEGYDSMGFQMSKPNLRSELEADLKR